MSKDDAPAGEPGRRWALAVLSLLSFVRNCAQYTPTRALLRPPEDLFRKGGWGWAGRENAGTDIRRCGQRSNARLVGAHLLK
jgi:hypothetical protein